MSSRNNKISLHNIVAVPVAFIVLGAFAMSIAAVMENVHFINATNQIFSLVSTVRMTTSDQKTFIEMPGEDVWADLERAARIPADTPRTNPWHGNIRILSLSDKAMRIESDLPTHDCRRLVEYFLSHQPADLGLLAIEAQSLNNSTWLRLYPLQTAHNYMTNTACGTSPYARLALIFTIR